MHFRDEIFDAYVIEVAPADRKDLYLVQKNVQFLKSFPEKVLIFEEKAIIFERNIFSQCFVDQFQVEIIAQIKFCELPQVIKQLQAKNLEVVSSKRSPFESEGFESAFADIIGIGGEK